MSIDVAHNRVFSVCRNKYLAVSDIAAGKIVTALPIGSGVDASAFDPATQLIFASNGDGTMTVVHEDTPDTYTVVEMVSTGSAAKTMALDPATYRVYLGTAPSGQASFKVIAVERTGLRNHICNPVRSYRSATAECCSRLSAVMNALVSTGALVLSSKT